MISSYIDTVGFDGQFLRGEFMAEVEYETHDGVDFEIIGLKIAAMKRDKHTRAPMLADGATWKDASFILDLLDRDEMDGLIEAAKDDHDGRTMGDTRLSAWGMVG